jgi:farnesyl diphosphate synthase
MSDHIFRVWLHVNQLLIENALRALFLHHDDQTALIKSMAYASLGGAKYMRALLVFATGEITHAPNTVLNKVACAVELVHAYSLVHDDLPSMDNDVLRRGKPACHVTFGESTAILTGDALQSRAFEVLSEPFDEISPTVQLSMIHILSQAIGGQGMVMGQALDLENTGKTLTLDQLKKMHYLKTGTLIRASIALGLLSGKPLSNSKKIALDRFAGYIGLLFQVKDDILDCEANSLQLGKTVGKDRQYNKPTYVSILGLSQAKEAALELYRDAVASLEPLGSSATKLCQLAYHITNRSF